MSAEERDEPNQQPSDEGDGQSSVLLRALTGTQEIARRWPKATVALLATLSGLGGAVLSALWYVQEVSHFANRLNRLEDSLVEARADARNELRDRVGTGVEAALRDHFAGVTVLPSLSVSTLRAERVEVTHNLGQRNARILVQIGKDMTDSPALLLHRQDGATAVALSANEDDASLRMHSAGGLTATLFTIDEDRAGELGAGLHLAPSDDPYELHGITLHSTKQHSDALLSVPPGEGNSANVKMRVVGKANDNNDQIEQAIRLFAGHDKHGRWLGALMGSPVMGTLSAFGYPETSRFTVEMQDTSGDKPLFDEWPKGR